MKQLDQQPSTVSSPLYDLRAPFLANCLFYLWASPKVERTTEWLGTLSIIQNEYDFANGRRGKFSRTDVQLVPRIRLEPELLKYLTQLATENDTTLNILINQLLKKDIELIAIGA